MTKQDCVEITHNIVFAISLVSIIFLGLAL